MNISWLAGTNPETQLVINHLLNSCTWIANQTFFRILPVFCTVILTTNLTCYIHRKMQLKLQFHKKLNYIKTNIEEIRTKLNNATVNIDLVNLSLTELKFKLLQDEIKPIEVLQAYQFKALELYDRGNSGICEFILEAEQQALDLPLLPNRDKLLLYGIPVSVKELYPIAGYDCTYGLVKCCNRPKQHDCTIIKVLKAQGAIPFVLTATSQMAMGCTGFNPIFGNTTHPFSDNHEPGGSSYGEAVLLALNGSLIGFGTDSAGSIRVPAHFCGLAGIKPTSQRISCQHFDKLHADQICLLPGGIGPMGRNIEDLAEILRAIFQPTMFNLDQNIPPLPFDEIKYTGVDKPKLRIGYYDTFDSPNLIQTVPSVRRGIHEAVEMLKSMGHEVIRFAPPDPYTGLLLSLRLGYICGPNLYHEAMYAEPTSWHTVFLKVLLQRTHMFRVLLDHVFGLIIGKPVALSRTLSGPRNLADCLKLLLDIENYKKQFTEAWDQTGSLDALICPVLAFPAFPKSASAICIPPSIVYVILYNLLDYPAGTVHVTHVNQDDIENAIKLCESTTNGISRFQKKILEMQKSSLGLPIGVQVVAKPYREELVLRVMKELELLVKEKSVR